MRKQLTTLLFLLGILSASSMYADSDVPLIHNVMAYESSSLAGDWNYIVDVQEEGYYDYRMNPTRWGFFNNAKPQKPEDLIEYDFDKSPTMKIPSDWNTQDERLFFYEGTVWFKKSFQAVPMTECRTLLYFGAVNYDCHVWVNGKKAGHHVGGFTPFNFDISDLLREGENNVIVKVDNKRHAEDVPTQIFDWWNYGGITRDVKLVKVPLLYMQDYSISLTPNPSIPSEARPPVAFRGGEGSRYTGEPVVTYKKPKASSTLMQNPAESDEFNDTKLGLQWQWHGNYDEKFGTATAFGTYRIYTYKMSDVRGHAPSEDTCRRVYGNGEDTFHLEGRRTDGRSYHDGTRLFCTCGEARW